MKKLNSISDFSNYLHSFKNGYVAFQRISKTHNNKKYYGYRYILEKPLQDENKQYLLSKYNNIIFSSCAYKYAPEIKHETIIIFDNKLETIGL